MYDKGFVKKGVGLLGCDVLMRAYHLQQQPLLQQLPGHVTRLPGSPLPLQCSSVRKCVGMTGYVRIRNVLV